MGIDGFHLFYRSSTLLVLIMSFISAAAIAITVAAAGPENALITALPGYKGKFLSKHYSGYIALEDDDDALGMNKSKHLFFYFVTSERNPSKDPLVLWLNGGPGCSSFDGFVYEHGPFNFKPGKTKKSIPTLYPNPYSWSKVSNIIYLDSPVGVGLSFSFNTTSYETGDTQTASDTHTFLLKWLEQFPEFVKNPFYIAGESYAGVYVPTLAEEVVKGIKAKMNPVINFKGYIIGNGVISDARFESIALISFAHGMALIPDDLYLNIVSTCGVDLNGDAPACQTSADQFYKDIEGLNIYDILEPCYHDPDGKTLNKSKLPYSFQQLGVTDRPMPVRKRLFGRAWPFRLVVENGVVPSWPELVKEGVNRRIDVPCTEDVIASAWLNNARVRKAIHAQPESVTGPWSLCMAIRYNHTTGSMVDYHKRLTKQGYRALIYSGDHDMCVPYTGTEAWTKSLGYKIVDGWRSWKLDNQIAGYLQAYEHNLTFLTIKGAGHTVPEYKPKEALQFYRRWLDGLPI